MQFSDILRVAASAPTGLAFPDIFTGATKGFRYDFRQSALGALASVNDLSPFSSTATQSTEAAQPTIATTADGLRGALFSGAQFLEIPAATGSVYSAAGATTVFFAVQADNHVGTIWMEARSSSNNPIFGLQTTGANANAFNGDNGAELNVITRSDAGGAVTNITSNEIFADNQNRIITMRVSPNTGRKFEIWIDNRKQPATSTHTGTLTLDKAALGAVLRATASTYFTGHIFEAVGVNAALTDDQILAVQRYLARKHFIAVPGAQGTNTITHYPRLVHFNGKPLVATTTANAASRITEITVDANGFRGPAYSQGAYSAADVHDAPALIVTPSNEIVLASVAHSTSTLRISKSQADSMTPAWALNKSQSIVTPTTLNSLGYPRLFLRSGEYILLLRARLDATETNQQQGLWDARTSDLDTNFAHEVKILQGDRPYANIEVNPADSNRLDMLISTSNPGDGNPVNNVYHGYYLLDAQTAHQSDGTAVTLPADPEDFTLLHDETATGLLSWVCCSPWFGADGHPRAAYIRYNADGSQSFMFRRWTGSAWTAAVEIAPSAGPTLSDNFIANGNLCPDPLDPNVVYLGRNIGAAGTDGVTVPHQIWRYVTADNGATWTGTQITNEAAACDTPWVSTEATEPRLCYATGYALGLASARMKMVHSLTGGAA